MPLPQALPPVSILPITHPAAAAAQPRQRGAECLRFAGGEWLINESWREPVDGGAVPRQRQHLYFQCSAAAPCEAMGEIGPADAGGAAPLLFRSGERCAIVLGRSVFQRWPRAQGPYWYRVTTQPFGAAAFFLRAYLRRHDAAAGAAPGLKLPEVPYAFGHLDLERNVLVTSRARADARFPLFLVYSANDYGLPWLFDHERTRRVNGMR